MVNKHTTERSDGSSQERLEEGNPAKKELPMTMHGILLQAAPHAWVATSTRDKNHEQHTLPAACQVPI